MAQPKHQEVRERILSEVTAGLLPQAMIPTERQLAERFGVSRMTVRQALNGLREEGVLHSVRGLGTFVAGPRLSKPPALTSFSEDLKSRGFTPSTRVLAREEVRLPTGIAVELGVTPGSRAYRIERLRLADGNPMCHEEVFLPAYRFPGLVDHPLDESLYGVLREHYGVVLRRAQQQIKAINLDPAMAELLTVDPGAAALLVKRITVDEEGRIVERGQSICRGDLYDFSLVVTRSPDARPGGDRTGIDQQSYERTVRARNRRPGTDSPPVPVSACKPEQAAHRSSTRRAGTPAGLADPRCPVGRSQPPQPAERESP